MTMVNIDLTEYTTLVAIKKTAEELKDAAMEGNLIKIPELVASLDKFITVYNDAILDGGK